MAPACAPCPAIPSKNSCPTPWHWAWRNIGPRLFPASCKPSQTGMWVAIRQCLIPCCLHTRCDPWRIPRGKRLWLRRVPARVDRDLAAADFLAEDFQVADLAAVVEERFDSGPGIWDLGSDHWAIEPSSHWVIEKTIKCN